MRVCGESKGSGEPHVGVKGRNDRGVCGPDHVPEGAPSPASREPILAVHKDSNRSTVPWYRLSLTVCEASFHGIRFGPNETGEEMDGGDKTRGELIVTVG